jgi:hypothetical protein
MIDIGKLEQKYKLNEKKTNKVQNQKVQQEIKPKAPLRPKYHPPPKIPAGIQEQIDRINNIKYTEYRSLITPLIGGSVWWAYKQVNGDVSNEEYQEIMTKVLTSRDINELLQDKLEILDTETGYTKLLLTMLSKGVEAQTKRVIVGHCEQEQVNSRIPQDKQEETPKNDEVVDKVVINELKKEIVVLKKESELNKLIEKSELDYTIPFKEMEQLNLSQKEFFLLNHETEIRKLIISNNSEEPSSSSQQVPVDSQPESS